MLFGKILSGKGDIKILSGEAIQENEQYTYNDKIKLKYLKNLRYGGDQATNWLWLVPIGLEWLKMAHLAQTSPNCHLLAEIGGWTDWT